VRGDSGYSGGQRVRLEQLPNDLLAQAVALGLAGAVYGSEYVSVNDPGGGSPCVGRHLYPRRHRNRPHAAMLPNEVHDAPPAIALLDVAYGEGSHLGPPQAAAQEHRQDRAVTQALGRRGVRSVQDF
jgi:hypothetical protein